MIELMLPILAAAAGGTGAYTVALATGFVVDPSVTELVKVVVGAGVTITMGWIAYRSLNRKLDEVNKKTAVIEGHVNSRETALTGEISALRQEVNILRGTLSEKRETAALLAQSAATSSSVNPPVKPPDYTKAQDG